VQVAQSGGRCPVPGNIQDQVGLSNLIELKMSLPIAGRLELDDLPTPTIL